MLWKINLNFYCFCVSFGYLCRKQMGMALVYDEWLFNREFGESPKQFLLP